MDLAVSTHLSRTRFEYFTFGADPDVAFRSICQCEDFLIAQLRIHLLNQLTVLQRQQTSICTNEQSRRSDRQEAVDLRICEGCDILDFWDTLKQANAKHPLSFSTNPERAVSGLRHCSRQVGHKDWIEQDVSRPILVFNQALCRRAKQQPPFPCSAD